MQSRHRTTHSRAGPVGTSGRLVLFWATLGSVLVLLLGFTEGHAAPSLPRTLSLGARGVSGFATDLAVDSHTGHVFVVSDAGEQFSGQPGALTTLDLKTGAIVHRTPVGGGPAAVVVDASSRRVFVLNLGKIADPQPPPGTVSVLDARSGALLATVSVGRGAGAPAVDETTNRVFVANQQSNSVSLLNATTGHSEAVISLPGAPAALAVAPRLGRVYLALQRPGEALSTGPVSIAELDARTGHVLRITDTRVVTLAVVALAVDERRGHLFLVSWSETSDGTAQGRVTTIDAASGDVVASTLVGNQPRAIAVNQTSGQVFVLNRGDDTVTSLAADTGRVLATLPAGYAPVAIAVDEQSDRVLVTDSNVGFGDSVLQHGGVTVLDGRAGRLLGTVTVGFLPGSIAMDAPSGQALVLSAGLSDRRNHYTTGSVAVLDMHATAASLARQEAPVAPFPVDVRWLRVDAGHPRILYLGGAIACLSLTTDYGCSGWVLRSTNGGGTWTDLRVPLGIFSNDARFSVAPLLLAPDGRHLYLGMGVFGGSPSSTSSGLIRSADGGRTWHNGGATGDYGGGLSAYVVSPAVSTRVYAAHYVLCFEDVARSSDGGATWQDGKSAPRPMPASCPPGGPVVADPTRADTVYINAHEGTTPAFVLRSDDAGLSWSTVTTPTMSPPLATFAVSATLHAGAPLIGRTADATVPADRRWRSTDGGRTWTATTCPGDLHGLCPAYTVENVFGAGASYAFLNDGIYRFSRDGPATTRLGISSALPVHTADLLAVQAGGHAGDLVYLLARQSRDNVNAALYRSADSGKTWQRIASSTLAHLSALPARIP